MERIVIAITNDTLRKSVTDILQKNGIKVRGSVKSGMEATRTLMRMDGGILICSPVLRDCTSDQLADRLGETVYLLVVGHPAALANCENGQTFKVSLPVKAPELVGSLRILMQLDERRYAVRRKPPARSSEDQALIQSAKDYLMDKRGMSEEEAHRFLQKQSMDTATPITEIARMILYHTE